jgi:hypothetical protein
MTDLVISKVPFWSAIITQTQGSISVPASSWGIVDIQPPSGETWLIDILFSINYSLTATTAKVSSAVYCDYDGATERIHGAMTYGAIGHASLFVSRILTNTLYARLKTYNGAGSAVPMYYGYSGFKLSQPQWRPLKSYNPSVWKRRPQVLPVVLDRIKDYVYEIYDHDVKDYRIAIVLEEDMPLAYDPNTNFPVERYTIYVFYDDLKGIADLISSDPKNTGYNKYIDILRKARLI